MRGSPLFCVDLSEDVSRSRGENWVAEARGSRHSRRIAAGINLASPVAEFGGSMGRVFTSMKSACFLTEPSSPFRKGSMGNLCCSLPFSARLGYRGPSRYTDRRGDSTALVRNLSTSWQRTRICVEWIRAGHGRKQALTRSPVGRREQKVRPTRPTLPMGRMRGLPVTMCGSVALSLLQWSTSVTGQSSAATATHRSSRFLDLNLRRKMVRFTRTSPHHTGQTE